MNKLAGMCYLAIGVFFVGVLNSACNSSRHSPVVVIDYEQFHKPLADCYGKTQDADACQSYPIALLNGFEEELTTAFIANPQCSGVRVASHLRDLTSAGATWKLLPQEFDETKRWQSWRLADPKFGDVAGYSGHGTPREIAAEVCGIVRTLGASFY